MFPAEGTLTPREQAKLETLVMRFEDIFVAPDPGPGLHGSDPSQNRYRRGSASQAELRRRSVTEREYGDSELEKMLASGVVRPMKSMDERAFICVHQD